MDTPAARHLSPAPRAVPLILSIRVLLGSVFCHIGWGLMLFGMIFVWAFDAGGAVRDIFRFAGHLEATEGVIVSWESTNVSVNETRVYEATYTFRSPDGQDVTGVSYRTGGNIEPGQPVTVEYRPSNPGISRVQGMRANVAGFGITFVYIFPLVGLAFAMLGVRNGIRARYLLSSGELALAKLISKEPTGTRINNQTVYKYTFEFEVPNSGVYHAVGKTHLAGVLDDEELERVVYDPRDPNEAKVLDELPCRPAIDDRGDFEARGQIGLAGANLVLPSLTLAVYVAYALFH